MTIKNNREIDEIIRKCNVERLKRKDKINIGENERAFVRTEDGNTMLESGIHIAGKKKEIFRFHLFKKYCDDFELYFVNDSEFKMYWGNGSIKVGIKRNNGTFDNYEIVGNGDIKIQIVDPFKVAKKINGNYDYYTTKQLEVIYKSEISAIANSVIAKLLNSGEYNLDALTEKMLEIGDKIKNEINNEANSQNIRKYGFMCESFSLNCLEKR